MKVGDLIRDIDTDDLVVIIEIENEWDYLVYHPRRGRYYIDCTEIEMIG